LRGDVLALVRRVSGGINEIGPETMFGLLADLYDSPDLRAVLQADQAGATAMTAILEAAARRGEVRLERLTPRVVSLPIDLVRRELLQTRAPVPDAVLVEIVDEIFLPLVHV
ncbi:MAG: TetR-like C-terminal domain-containing protein, partial [Candidatus Limnocylindrales bacterium]